MKPLSIKEQIDMERYGISEAEYFKTVLDGVTIRGDFNKNNLNMLKKLSLAVCLAGLVGAPAFADDTIDVTFTGQISDNACMFSINGQDNQTVQLGTIPAVANATGLIQTLKFELTNCGSTFNGASVSVKQSNGAFDHTAGVGKLIPSNFGDSTNTARIAFYENEDATTSWTLDGVDNALRFNLETLEVSRFVRLEAGTNPLESEVHGMVQFLITYDPVSGNQ